MRTYAPSWCRLVRSGLAGGLLILWGASPSYAQGRAFNPSLSGPSRQIGNFGKVGGSLGSQYARSSGAGARGVAPIVHRNSIGQGPSTLGLGLGNGQRIVPGGGVSGRLLNLYSPVRSSTGTRGLASPVQRGLFEPVSDYPTIATPNISAEQVFKLVKRSRRARRASEYSHLPMVRPSTGERGRLLTQMANSEQPAYGDEQGATGSEKSTYRRMIKLRKENLSKRYTQYLRRGWAAFQSDNYSQATLLFDSALAIQPGEPDGQFGQFATTVASHHWQSAAKALHAMLASEDYALADVLVRYDGLLRERYYPTHERFDQDMALISQIAISKTGQSEVDGILAVMKWLGGSRREGQSIAARIHRVAPYTEWAKLSAILAEATRQKPVDKPPVTSQSRPLPSQADLDGGNK